MSLPTRCGSERARTVVTVLTGRSYRSHAVSVSASVAAMDSRTSEQVSVQRTQDIQGMLEALPSFLPAPVPADPPLPSSYEEYMRSRR